MSSKKKEQRVNKKVVYRVWNPKVGKFQYFTFGQIWSPDIVEAYNNAVCEGYIFDVGTGKKDINGKDIFVGDHIVGLDRLPRDYSLYRRPPRDYDIVQLLDNRLVRSTYNGTIEVHPDFNMVGNYEIVGDVYGKSRK